MTFFKSDGTIVDLYGVKYGRTFHRKIGVKGQFQIEKEKEEKALEEYSNEKSPLVLSIFKDNGIEFNTTFANSGLHIGFFKGEIDVHLIDGDNKTNSRYGKNDNIMKIALPMDIGVGQLSKLIEQLSFLLITNNLHQVEIKGRLGNGWSGE